MGVSAVVITYNEERNIEACLKSLSWADEIVVVDAMSTDATCEIAGRYTSRIYRRPWEGYATARRYAIQLATNEWVLSVDADECVTPELRAEIEAAARRGETDGFLIPRRAYFMGRWIKHCGWYPGYGLRLFRKDRARVTEKLVHEGMRIAGSTGRLSNPILHYTYPTVNSYFERFSRYTSLAAEDLHRSGRKSGLWHMLVRPPFQFAKMYFVKLGFLDGFEGFIVCLFSAFHVLVKYVKLRELSRGTRPRGRRSTE